jgi:ABC-type branched-subunit amino acid transport system substrate-binding protein
MPDQNSKVTEAARRATLCTLLLAGLAACPNTDVVKPITVDVFVSSGENRMEKGAKEPYQVAVNDINAAGGINGQELQIWLHDEAPDKADVDAVGLKDTGVRVLFAGPSDIAIPLVRDVATPSQVFVFATASSSMLLTTEYAGQAAGYYARTSFSAASAAKKLARMAYDDGARRIGLLYAEDGIGPEYSSAFAQAFRDEGGELTGDPPAAQFLGAGALQPSYKKELTVAAEGASLVNGKPAIAALVSADAFKVLLRDAAASGLSFQWYGGHTVREKGVLDESPTAAEGMKGVAPAHGKGASYAFYESSFKTAFPDLDPSSNWFPNSYDAMMVYALDLARSGGGVPNADKLKTNLRKIANAGIGKKTVGPGDLLSAFETIGAGGDCDYQGASGSLDFGGNGEVFGNWIEFRVQDGSFILETDPNF